MVVFQVSHAVLDVSRGIIVVIDRENRVVVIRMDAVGCRRLQGDGRGDVPLCSHFHANALLVDVGHDEVDKLAGVGVGTGGGVLEHVFAIKTAVPDKIGVMGFSAGGHLVMSSVELFEKDDWPAFVVPVYPVVTMTASCVHKRSRRGLLGDSRVRNKELRELLSLEKHVPSDCPPVFLINCKDDPVVDYHNSILLDSALRSQKIPHQYLLYETGGHGFGASDIKGTPECRQWKEEFIKWINKILKI